MQGNEFEGLVDKPPSLYIDILLIILQKLIMRYRFYEK